MEISSLFNSPLLLNAVLVSVYIGFFITEKIYPLRKTTAKLSYRIFVNVIMTGLALVVAAIVVNPIAQFSLAWTHNNPFGLMHWLSLPGSLYFIVGFLLMDLTFYYWHWLNHNVAILWRFHNVHHIDPDLDVTTSIRFHYIEIAYSGLFRLIQLMMLGVSPSIFLTYQLFFQLNTFFQHSNVKLPIALEKLLNIFIVTPRMHGIHHSQIMEETNSNYSVIFSFWDRLHRTLRLNVPQQDIHIGVPGYAAANDNRLKNVMMMSFRKQRRYWVTGESCCKKRDRKSSVATITEMME